MILINKRTNKPVKLGDILVFENCKREGEIFTVGEIVEPTEHAPLGFIKSPKEGIGWQQQYPNVLGCEFKEDNVTPIKG